MDLWLRDWHWLILGMGLIIAELFLPSFTIFWFGLGAMVVAAWLFVAPSLPLTGQLLVWALASALFTWLWFRLIRPRMKDRTKAGISREAVVGESGRVIRAPESDRRGTVRFATPLLGADEWPFICEQAVNPGDRVFVRDISGNTLIVEKRQ
ncbi:MAG: NfeD family protein [Desulfobacteraceae bacterium]|jgi:membrane protein implicated in regulation of membrane protease activity|nr:NfeD family protein [Desulfobacteraceae bacterium]